MKKTDKPLWRHLKDLQDLKEEVLPQYKELYDYFVTIFNQKRKLRISQHRDDGSFRSADTDGNAGCCEAVVGDAVGVPVTKEFFGYGGDGGKDLTVRVRCPRSGEVKKKPLGIGVQWLGYHDHGNILLNCDDPDRYKNSDVFVLVGGTVFKGLHIIGWEWKSVLYKTNPRDFDYGLRYHKPDVELNSIDKLLEIIVRD
jgi:hypothetical protein